MGEYMLQEMVPKGIDVYIGVQSEEVLKRCVDTRVIFGTMLKEMLTRSPER